MEGNAAIEMNRHTTCMKICGSVVSLSFIFPHPPGDKKNHKHTVYQVYPVSRITGEGRAEFLRAWGAGFEQEGAGGRGGRDNSICARKL